MKCCNRLISVWDQSLKAIMDYQLVHFSYLKKPLKDKCFYRQKCINFVLDPNRYFLGPLNIFLNMKKSYYTQKSN